MFSSPIRLPVVRPLPTGPSPVDDGAPVVLFLPVRDEAPRLAAVLGRVPSAVEGRRVVVVVVDDGSSDDSAALAAAHGAVVVSHPCPQGLGAAVRTGLATATALDACAVAFCDADGEYDPGELGRLVAPIIAGEADYVVGSRFAGRIEWMRPHRRLGNRLLTAALRWVVRTRISDGQSGYRALSAHAAATATIPHDYNYAQVLTIDLLGRGYRYREVPITYHFRTSGRSFVRLGTYLRHVVPTVLRQLGAMRHALETCGGGADLRRETSVVGC